ncbi:hypothetical protein GU243_22775 [Pseudarthrobacter psychrotolerans]|uniref:Uncharacterized protein n=1 Tax=Pseudarthrobacter psychrotolerans TaxID=2697569 RepID=A0A6P1NYZ5_9MICC|nr:hypothetical protein GU243_22775 [Pseudarthrobacter psychrotolerans]
MARKPLAHAAPLFAACLLIIAGVWSLVVWPQFLRRVMKDPRARDAAGKATKFLTVHVVLVSISMVLGAATAVIGIMGLLG